MTRWHIYLVRAGDGTLYTGIATDPARRLNEHGGQPVRGAKYLRGRAPLTLAFSRELGSRSLALRVEHRVKRLSRSKKEALIEADPDVEQLLALVAIE